MGMILMKIGVNMMKQKIKATMSLTDSIEHGFKGEFGENIIKTNEPLYFYHLINKDADMNNGIISL